MTWVKVFGVFLVVVALATGFVHLDRHFRAEQEVRDAKIQHLRETCHRTGRHRMLEGRANTVLDEHRCPDGTIYWLEGDGVWSD